VNSLRKKTLDKPRILCYNGQQLLQEAIVMTHTHNAIIIIIDIAIIGGAGLRCAELRS